MKKRLTDFFDTLVTLPILGLLYVISVMPDTLAYRICMALGSMARVLRIRYRVVDNNLQIAFPQMARQERVRLIKKVYANFGRLTGEWLSARKNMQTLEKKVRCVGVEEFPKALQEGRGIIVCSAHFGHWELLASAVAVHGKAPLKIIRNKLKNRRLDKWFTQIHADMGFGEIMRSQSALRIFRHLKENEIIGMLVDQNGRSGGLWLPFFNRPTSFYRGPGQIASKTGCAVIMAFCYPQRDGTWEVQFSRLKREMTGNVEEDTRRVMGSYAALLEEAIIRYPDWYFWFHRRWKTKVPKAVLQQWEPK
ncbi:MAG: lysophospholipid acyltransferase family protein [bacterium]